MTEMRIAQHLQSEGKGRNGRIDYLVGGMETIVDIIASITEIAMNEISVHF